MVPWRCRISISIPLGPEITLGSQCATFAVPHHGTGHSSPPPLPRRWWREGGAETASGDDGGPRTPPGTHLSVAPICRAVLMTHVPQAINASLKSTRTQNGMQTEADEVMRSGRVTKPMARGGGAGTSQRLTACCEARDRGAYRFRTHLEPLFPTGTWVSGSGHGG